MRWGKFMTAGAIVFSMAFPSRIGLGMPSISERREEIREHEREMNSSSGMAAPEELVSIEQYIALALRRNAALKAAFEKWQASFQRIPQAFSLPDPRFTYEKETRSGDREDSYTVSQTIPFPDKLWIRRNRAFYDSEVAYQDFSRARLELIVQLSEAYYEYAYLYKKTLITREHLRLLASLERTAQSRYAASALGNQDLLKIQLELASLENELSSVEDLLRPVQVRLTSLLNISAHTPLPWPKGSLGELKDDERYQHVEVLADKMGERNPDLLAFDKKVQREQENLRLARREYLPDLTVGLTKGSAMGTMSSEKEPLMVMLSVNVPLWAGRIRAGVREAEAGLSAVQQNKKEKENELLWELAMAHYKMRDLRRQVQLHEDLLIPTAVQALNAAKTAYEAGEIDFQSLIDSQRVLLNLKNAYYRHSADYHNQTYILQALLGDAGPERILTDGQ